MWQLIKAELSYKKRNSLLLLTFGVPFLFFVSLRWNEISSFWITWLTFLFCQNWNTFFNKDRRISKLKLLPLSTKQFAFVRIIIITTFAIGVILISTLIYANQDFNFIDRIILPFSIIVFGFSLYFIIRDLLLLKLRMLGFTAAKMIVLITITVVLLNILTVYALFMAKTSGKVPFGIDTFFSFFEQNNPFGANLLWQIILLSAIISALLSVFSFERRKAYLE